VNLTWNGQEEIAAGKEAVWAFINDPSKIAGCLPDVQSTTIRDAHSFDSIVGVALKISGGGLGSVVDLVAGADLTSNGEKATTLRWNGTASVRGPVATVGGRVLDTQAHRVISTTFENVKNRLGGST
jgi:uncharacterized protein